VDSFEDLQNVTLNVRAIREVHEELDYEHRWLQNSAGLLQYILKKLNFVFFIRCLLSFSIIHEDVERSVENQLGYEILQNVDERSKVFVFLDLIDFHSFEHNLEKWLAFLFIKLQLIV
jgi:hypothetical protein